MEEEPALEKRKHKRKHFEYFAVFCFRDFMYAFIIHRNKELSISNGLFEASETKNGLFYCDFRSCSFGNRVTVKSGSRVRIPPSPPKNLVVRVATRFFSFATLMIKQSSSALFYTWLMCEVICEQ